MKVIDDVSSVLVVITGKMLQMKMLGLFLGHHLQFSGYVNW